MTQNATQQTLARLLAIDWSDTETAFDHVPSRAALMVEYLRRTAQWIDALGEGDWPFPDLASQLAPEVRASKETMAQLDEISTYISWPQVRKSVESTLHWAAVLDTPNIHKPNLPNPYEPLLIVFERGGAFVTGNGLIDLSGQMLYPKSWQERLHPEPFVALDTYILDQLDKTG